MFLEAVSPSMRAVEVVIRELSSSDVPVLLLAESGRIDVASSDQEEPVEGLQDLRGSAVVGGRDHHGTRPGTSERLEVGERNGRRGRAPSFDPSGRKAVCDDADKRPAHDGQCRRGPGAVGLC